MSFLCPFSAPKNSLSIASGIASPRISPSKFFPDQLITATLSSLHCIPVEKQQSSSISFISSGCLASMCKPKANFSTLGQSSDMPIATDRKKKLRETTLCMLRRVSVKFIQKKAHVIGCN
eukprot:NODE_290_length_11632_cov_0.441256.p7 type:complete len:120 gc:universal NODE_290_length_11632_cov_0.441256:11183-11542(+)